MWYFHDEFKDFRFTFAIGIPDPEMLPLSLYQSSLRQRSAVQMLSATLQSRLGEIPKRIRRYIIRTHSNPSGPEARPITFSCPNNAATGCANFV